MAVDIRMMSGGWHRKHGTHTHGGRVTITVILKGPACSSSEWTVQQQSAIGKLLVEGEPNVS